MILKISVRESNVRVKAPVPNTSITPFLIPAAAGLGPGG